MTTKLNDLLKKIHDTTTKMQGHSTTEIVETLREVSKALTVLSDQQQVLVTSQVQKLELKPGDVLLVKLGDQATGWIPSPEVEPRIVDLLNKAFEISGLDNKVSAVIWNYAINAEVVRKS